MMLATKLQEAAANSTLPTYIEDIFSTYLYTGNGSTQTITNGIDLAGKGGMVWQKLRDTATSHALIDTARGGSYYIESNSTFAQDPAGATTFNSNGYSLGSANGRWNANGYTYASWTFRKQPKFFDVVTYTGNGASYQDVAHSLGSVPGCIMVKCTSTGSTNWMVAHRASALVNANLILNSTSSAATIASETIAYSSVDGSFNGYFRVLNDLGTADSNNYLNVSGRTYVAYLFAHNAGGFGLTGTDNVISCGSFTTDASGNATVDLGYEPQWVMIKRTQDTGLGGNWYIQDSARLWAVRPAGGTYYLSAESSSAEAYGSDVLTYPTSTGFVFNQNAAVFNSKNFIYIAIRRGPMKVPTSGTSVFYPLARTGNNTQTNLTGFGFPPDLAWTNRRDGAEGFTSDKLRGPTKYLTSQTTAAEGTYSSGLITLNQNGVTIGTSNEWNAGTPIANWFFRRAPSFFDVVCYTGTGSARTVTHNLGVAPELVFIKQRSNTGGNWFVGSQFSGTGYNYSILNSASSGSAFLYTDGIVYNAAPTTTTLSLSNSGGTNGNTQTYVAYLFATCAGVSKVGSYTGNGSSQTINCGFTSGARFILIRKTNDTQSWYVFDSARGIVSGNDPVLLLNTTDSEFTTYDSVDPNSTGFVVNSDLIGLNDSGGNYIFLAIA